MKVKRWPVHDQRRGALEQEREGNLAQGIVIENKKDKGIETRGDEEMDRKERGAVASTARPPFGGGSLIEDRYSRSRTRPYLTGESADGNQHSA